MVMDSQNQLSITQGVGGRIKPVMINTWKAKRSCAEKNIGTVRDFQE